jgi:hypothetical protein
MLELLEQLFAVLQKEQVSEISMRSTVEPIVVQVEL